jgi:hypothetical protein
MTVQLDHPQVPSNFTELAVAVGRVEEKVSRIAGMEDRLRDVEHAVQRIEARAPERTSAWTKAAVILGLPSSVIALIVVVFAVVNPGAGL